MKRQATFLRTVAIAALLTTGRFAPAAAPAASPAPTEPKIVDCRLGFHGSYKVGFWTPMWVDVAGSDLAGLQVEVTVRDSDGVPATARADVSRPTGEPLARRSTTLLYVKIGRMESSVRVRLLADEEVLDHVTLLPGPEAGNGRILAGLPVTSELLLTFGPAPIGLSQALLSLDAVRGELARQVVHLDRVEDLPTEWFGYEAVDTLVLAAGDAALFEALAADDVRLSALRRWVELGGRLVVLCGRSAPELIGDSGPLAEFVPGRFVDMIDLSQTSALEHFAGSVVPILTRHSRLDLPVAQLSDVSGRIESYAGRQPTDLPLVVWAPRGLGEIVFAGIDVDQPPLVDWRGRPDLLRALVGLGTTPLDGAGDWSLKLATSGYNDLAGALRLRLGRSVPSVTTIAFSAVALLAIGYLLVLGPLDYLVVHKLLGRPMVAWVTFPLIVVATSGGAYWLAEHTRGTRHVNQLELVDVDTIHGRARGTYWATLYSPGAERYDLSLAARLLGRELPQPPEVLLSAWGLPGSGVGGTQAVGGEWEANSVGYALASDLSALVGVPIQVASTKSLVAQWQAPVGTLVEAQLAADADGVLAGTITNRSSARWTNPLLLYGGWAYRLNDVPDAARVDVGAQAEPVRARALLARRARSSGSAADQDADRSVFLPDRASLGGLLYAMMFYEEVGGYGFVGLPSRYQAYCDLSQLLDLDRAVLVVRYAGPSSELLDGASGTPLGDEPEPRLVMYRFVLPVENSD